MCKVGFAQLLDKHRAEWDEGLFTLWSPQPLPGCCIFSRCLHGQRVRHHFSCCRNIIVTSCRCANERKKEQQHSGVISIHDSSFLQKKKKIDKKELFYTDVDDSGVDILRYFRVLRPRDYVGLYVHFLPTTL